MHEAKSETIAFIENVRKYNKLCMINTVITLTCALCLPSTINYWIPVPIVLYYVHVEDIVSTNS